MFRRRGSRRYIKPVVKRNCDRIIRGGQIGLTASTQSILYLGS